MNHRFVFLSLALVSSFGCWGKIVIRGKILGYDGKSVVYYSPTIEGIHTPYWKEVQPASNGTFRIEYENTGYGSVRISYNRIHYRFFHDENSQIYFEIKEVPEGNNKRIPGRRIFQVTDSIKQFITVKISGDYEFINRFYNQNLRSSYFTTRMVDGSYYAYLINDAATPSIAMSIVDSLSQIEIDKINQLPWRVNIENLELQKKENEIREFLINEVHAFYSAVYLSGMFLKRKYQIIKVMKDSSSNPNLYNRDWEISIEKLAEQSKQNLKVATGSSDYIDFMETMAYALSSYKQYNFPQNPTSSLDEMVVNRLFNYDTTLFRDEKSRFAYELSGLQLYLNDQLFFSPALLQSVYALQAKHPKSANMDFYKPQIEKLKASIEASHQKFEKGKIIGTNYHSFNSLIKRFEGKNLLIDIWATWCHPCIEEFKYRSSFLPFVESEQIEILYISIDKPEWDDRWRQSIKFNQLEGNHFRADPKFIDDMWRAIGDYTGAIPRYVLIDKQGKIFKSTAARPREGLELGKQIESLLAQN